MAGIGIIANPHSKLNRLNPGRQKLLSYLAGERGQFALTHDLNELKQVADDFRKRQIRILAINGGDGTVSRTISAFIRAYGSDPLPDIAILRGGTMNMLADNLRIKGSPEHNLFCLLEMHSASLPFRKVTLNTLKIQDNYGFLFADGTSARFLQEFYKNKTGSLGVFKLIGKMACSFLFRGSLYREIVRSQHVKIHLESRLASEHDSLSVFCSTVDKMPMGSRLFPGAMEAENQFQVVSVTLRESELIRSLLLDFVFYPERSSKSKLRFSTRELQLESQQAEIYSLDGELYHKEEEHLEISVGPEVSFIVPDTLEDCLLKTEVKH